MLAFMGFKVCRRHLKNDYEDSGILDILFKDILEAILLLCSGGRVPSKVLLQSLPFSSMFCLRIYSVKFLCVVQVKQPDHKPLTLGPAPSSNRRIPKLLS